MGKFSPILGSLRLKPGEQATIYVFPEGQTSVSCYKPPFSTYLPNEKATHWGGWASLKYTEFSWVGQRCWRPFKARGYLFFFFLF